MTAAVTGAASVGRRVDAALAADRRLIRLVAARRTLYSRSDLPVASYYAQVRRLWQEVADQMGWTVAEVRRKWSHLRNSYSRHLRNAMVGARTGRGRAVSRWHLADDLAFLREHMATDTRTVTYAPALLALQLSESSTDADTGAESWTAAGAGTAVEAWAAAGAGAGAGTGAEGWTGGSADSWAGGSLDGDMEEGSFSADENSSYFQFFRGLHEEYRELAPRRRRAWRRACLQLLHAELDAAEAEAQAEADAEQTQEELDVKPTIVEHPLPEHA